ncbi:type IV pilus secretin PilQ [bacterium]|nr:type IV pilus secretin PilQ [bacterium]
MKMTRMLLCCIGLLFLVSLSSCSMLESESPQAPSEIEGELANLDDGGGEESESLAEESSDDLEDLDIESASTEESPAVAKNDDGSFSDIENFNEDLIEEELSNEDLDKTNLADIEEIPNKENIQEKAQNNNLEEDLDLETADVAPAPETTPAPVVTAPVEETTVAPPTNAITNLEYKSQDSGGSVVISAQRPFEYQVREEPEFNQTIIEALDVNLAPRFKQPYIAKDFGQAVATINAYQERGSNVATIVIQYKEAMKPNISMVGNSLMVQSGGVHSSKPSYVANADATSAGTENSIISSSLSVPGEDKRINIQLDDIPVSDLIKLIADEIGFNVIVDEDVTGKVNNVKLIDVPWKEALSSILGAQGLAYERKGQIVRVATVGKLTKELNATKERLDAELGARTAASTMTIKVVPVSYADITSLVNQITPVLTPSKGKVTPDMRSSSVVIYDLEDNVKRAEQIIRSLDVKPIQVLVEGRIIEAKSDFLKQFGINWNAGLSPGSTNATVGIQGIAGKGPGTFAGGGLGNVSFGTVGGLDSLSSALAIYEQEEKIKILSSPRIVTINKEKALIQQTEQVPIQTVTATQGITQTTVSFRDVILKVEVTPQVTFQADMILDIAVRRDIPGGDVSGSRAINTREANAKVLVKDGQSVVMGGILSMDDVLNEGGIPWLKDIPILGYLFKTKTKQVIKNELVIFLQPKILNNDTMDNDLQLGELKSVSPPLAPPPSGDGTGDDFDAEDIEKEMETL